MNQQTTFSFRNKSLFAFLVGSVVFFAGCKKDSSIENNNPSVAATDANSEKISALAAATYEGFGAGATGGANSSTVYHVTNLNASGTGSLAAGIGSNKKIVFDIGGTITGQFDLSRVSYLTIDATSAPSPGITINGDNLGDCITFDGTQSHHIIFKGIRVRNGGNDGISIMNGAHDIVIDHCSSSGNRDGNLDITVGAINITVQYCILGGGDPNNPDYSGTMLLGYSPKNISVHHTFFSPATVGGVGERCPNISDPQLSGPANYLMADFRNNLVWKWGRNNGAGSGYGTAVFNYGTANVVNNYYYSIQDPASATNTDDGYGASADGQAYMAGNVSGNSGVNANSPSNHAEWPIPSSAAITPQSACDAANAILSQAGPRPLDAIDQALIGGITLSNCTVTTNQLPTVNAGTDQTITLPVSSVTLTGTASDPDGTIASYLWTKVSGTGGTITSSTAATTTITGLAAGTYVYNLKVTDNSGGTASDNITVTVNPVVTVNQVPVVNAGADQTITLPVSSVTLTGTASDPDGTIASYLWTKVSGTGGAITTSAAATTTITGLTAGSYVFNLKVTDNAGATASDNITVIVNPVVVVNQVPVVNAGADKTITLPVNSVTLTGTASDPDGTIASYLWTKVSGTGGTITSPAAATTTVTGLTAGSYVFNLKVTDNSGATASDNITVTVNPAATINMLPLVNAGADQTITLPVSSVTLTGIASDPDGTIAAYLWTKVSGTGGTIVSAATASTSVTGLTAGTYVYNLKVTDNSGATASDQITVFVNPASTGGGYGTLAFSESYDVSSSVNTNQGLRNSVSFTTFRTGPGSFRSEVRAGDPPISGGSRSEMAYTTTAQNPTEGVLEYDVYYENWNSFEGFGHSIEWVAGTSGASALLSLQNYSGKFNVVRSIGSVTTNQTGTLMTCSSNTWYTLRWEYKWSTGTDGYIRLYINNVLYYSFTGKTADGSGQKLKLGQARWPDTGNTMQTTSVCYYDNVKIYKK